MSQTGVDFRNVRARNITISGVSVSPAADMGGRRVHYMSGDPGDRYTHRPEEYERAKSAVLEGGRTVALTTALHGAGGYGKTTLANALCRDPEIRREFPDGILRVELGKEVRDVTSQVLNLSDLIGPARQLSRVADLSTASELLAEAIGDARILLVIDDVWHEAQLRPFLRGGPNCVRLVTTRVPHAIPAGHVAISIDQMTMQQATDVLTTGLPYPDHAENHHRLRELAERLGFWAQMLAIANGWIATRIKNRESASSAIVAFGTRLIRRGLAGFDPTNEVQRNRAIRICVEASLEELDPATELARFNELAVLPEDTDVPISVVTDLWAASSGYGRG